MNLVAGQGYEYENRKLDAKLHFSARSNQQNVEIDWLIVWCLFKCRDISYYVPACFRVSRCEKKRLHGNIAKVS